MIDWGVVGVYILSLVLLASAIRDDVWLVKHRTNGRKLWLIPFLIMNAINVLYILVVIADTLYPPFLNNQALNYISRFDRLYIFGTFAVSQYYTRKALEDKLKKQQEKLEKEGQGLLV
jgi:hypothetical protein